MGQQTKICQVRYNPREIILIDGSKEFQFNEVDSDSEIDNDIIPEDYKLSVTEHRNKFSIISSSTQKNTKKFGGVACRKAPVKRKRKSNRLWRKAILELKFAVKPEIIVLD